MHEVIEEGRRKMRQKQTHAHKPTGKENNEPCPSSPPTLTNRQKKNKPVHEDSRRRKPISPYSSLLQVSEKG
ncbi:hypothetical protein DPEC_G00283600 [Dallia pectoralis]|uniref:Uncharacterized protein n=1 Tax=Dallia pectoralis TaxID=75939 RepID=A0ACC2FJJ2_DALPE|nr:hypothetical protein DPEC_G00283600 [Dallia pectoralis]